MEISIFILEQARNWREWIGGRTCQYNYFGGGKPYFVMQISRLTLLLGRHNHAEVFIWGGIAPYRYVPVLVLSMLVVALKYCFSCTFLHIASQTTQIIFAGGPMRMRFGISLSWRDVHFLY